MDRKNSSSPIPKQETQVHVKEASESLETYDRAAGFLAKYELEHGQVPSLTRQEEKAMVRRFDLLLVPLITISTTIGALDKVAVGQGAIYGMLEDVHLVGQQYSWISSSIYLGIIIAALPQMYLMKRFTTHKYIATNVFWWGSLSMLMAACQNFRSMITVRILLGLFESIVLSASMLILSGFYKRDEQPTRTAICFSTFSSVFNGLIGYGCSFAPADSSIAPWRIIFLSCGSFTCCYAVILWFFLPSTVMDAVWMKSPLRRAQALLRVKDEKLGTENHVVKWDQVRELFWDPKTYFMFLISLLNNIPNGGIIGFNGIVIKSLGYSSRITSLLTIPTGVLTFVVSFIFSWIAGKTTKHRTIIGALSVIPPTIGVIMLQVLPLDNPKGRLAGIYVLYTFWSPYILGQAIMMNNTAGLTKKTAMYAVNYIGYAIGNLIGPQIFLTKEAPSYTTAIKTMLVCEVIDASLFILYGLYCRHLNAQKRKRLVELDSQQTNPKPMPSRRADIVHDDGLMDLTDVQNLHFIYMT
ncbi:MFS general substrate transporter [Mycena floridula]|nr:MFS general substrate transporter [Mycena floridula]